NLRPLASTNPGHSTFFGLAGLCLRRRVKGNSEGVYLVRGSVSFCSCSKPNKPEKPDRPDEPDPAKCHDLGASPLSYRENGASRENPLPYCAPGGRGSVIHEFSDVYIFGNIKVRHTCTTTSRGDGRRNTLRPFCVNVRDNDTRTTLAQCFTKGTSDPRGTASHNRDFALKLICHAVAPSCEAARYSGRPLSRRL